MGNPMEDFKPSRETVNPVDELIGIREGQVAELTNKLNAILSMWSNLVLEAKANSNPEEIKNKIDSLRNQATDVQGNIEAFKESLKNISK